MTVTLARRPSTATLRDAQPGDLAVIQSILNAPDNLDKLAAYPDAALLAAMSDDDQSLSVLDLPGTGVAAFLWLTGLATHPIGPTIEEFGALHPGFGHGGQLFDLVVGKHYSSRSVLLAVAGDNARAIAFYERRGFRRKEVRPAVWHRRAGPVADALIMQLDPDPERALTPNQAQVLGYLRQANAPLTAYQLLGRMQGERGAVAPPTVYRALQRLEDAGLIRRIATLHAWTPVASTNPDVVVICNDCGTVRSMVAPHVLASLQRSLVAEGFTDARQTIEVHGRCGGCTEGRG
jgi:Fur family transcriptional regulator, zinc uptake regulator